MKLQVVGNTNPNTWCRCFVGTRAQITAANLPNGSVTIASQTVGLTNVGSGTAFSILPTYRKVATWFKVS